MNLKKHYTWDIKDSSKVGEFMTCRRKFFYRYILGWSLDFPNNHLVFGTAVHEGMEYMLLNGYDKYDEAYEKFLKSYRKEFPEPLDPVFYPKTPQRAREMFKHYSERYPRDLSDFDLLYTEVSGIVPIGDSDVMFYRLDSVMRGETGIFSLDHKTGSSFTDTWAQNWTLDLQMGLYAWVLNCMFEENVRGMVVNGIFFGRKVKIPKPFNPEGAFQRVPINLSGDFLQDRLDTIRYYYDEINHEHEILLTDDKDSLPTMSSFPKNNKACWSYGRMCAYHDFCNAWTNPLRNVGECPAEFKIEFWDPTAQDTTTQWDLTKEVA